MIEHRSDNKVLVPEHHDHLVDRRERQTVMDGKVVHFATRFDGRDARGPFDISASRTAVVVHHAVINSRHELAVFIAALRIAGHEAVDLARSDGGRFDPR